MHFSPEFPMRVREEWIYKILREYSYRFTEGELEHLVDTLTGDLNEKLFSHIDPEE